MVSPAAESKVWGAVYIPSRAYNAYQMWNEYQPAESERDLGYAARLRLNALRVWLSYEYWLENAPELEERFRHLLMAADTFGMKIMPSLFETCGVQPTREAMLDKNPLTAVSVASPNREIVTNPDLWEEPNRFVDWFMDRFKNDGRVLAIEIMNEPNTLMQHRCARAMLQRAAGHQGSIPLTVACAQIEDYIFYMDATLDVLHSIMRTSRHRLSTHPQGLRNWPTRRPSWVSRSGCRNGSGFATRSSGKAKA